jgi:hypothetical protein
MTAPIAKSLITHEQTNPEERHLVRRVIMSPTTLIGTAGHTGSRAWSRSRLCSKCLTMRWNPQQRGHYSALDPVAAPHSKRRSRSPGEIPPSSPAYAATLLDRGCVMHFF